MGQQTLFRPFPDPFEISNDWAPDVRCDNPDTAEDFCGKSCNGPRGTDDFCTSWHKHHACVSVGVFVGFWGVVYMCPHVTCARNARTYVNVCVCVTNTLTGICMSATRIPWLREYVCVCRTHIPVRVCLSHACRTSGGTTPSSCLHLSRPHPTHTHTRSWCVHVSVCALSLSEWVSVAATEDWSQIAAHSV